MPRPPSNPFRNLSPTLPPLTTVIGIVCKDGVVMASDTQATGFTTESIPKVRPFGKTVTLGCAGSAEYISLFQDYVGNEQSAIDKGEFKSALRKAIDNYSEYIANRIDTLKLSRLPGFDPRNLYPDGIMAGYDKEAKKYRLFEFSSPNPCRELEWPIECRATAGSGGIAATVILKTIENSVAPGEPTQTIWTWFSTKTIAQLCKIILGQISQIDPYSSGDMIIKLTPEGNTLFSHRDIFEEGQDRVAQLVKQANSEIPTQWRDKVAGYKPIWELLSKL